MEGRKLPFIQYIHDKSKLFSNSREIRVKLFSRKIHMRHVYIDCVNLTHGLVVCLGVEAGDVQGDYVTGISVYHFCTYIMYAYSVHVAILYVQKTVYVVT